MTSATVMACHRPPEAGMDVRFLIQVDTLCHKITQTLELFAHNKSAREAVDHARQIKILTALGSAAAQSTV